MVDQIVFTRLLINIWLIKMAITGQIVITRCNLLSNVNVVLSSSLHRCLINIWLIKLSSLDVIFDAPSVLLHLRQGETPKLTPDGFEVVIECEVGSQLLRSLVPFLVAGHSIEEDVEVGFSGFCNSAVLLQAHLSLTIILATTVILVTESPVGEVRRELGLVIQIHPRSVPSPVPLLTIDGTGLPQTVL